jgi:hypothetical protein
MTFMVTAGHVGDYEKWREMFDQDPPRAREHAAGHRVFQSVDDPNEVVVQVEFRSHDAATEGRDRLLASGVLERLELRHGPTVVEAAE